MLFLLTGSSGIFPTTLVRYSCLGRYEQRVATNTSRETPWLRRRYGYLFLTCYHSPVTNDAMAVWPVIAQNLEFKPRAAYAVGEASASEV